MGRLGAKEPDRARMLTSGAAGVACQPRHDGPRIGLAGGLQGPPDAGLNNDLSGLSKELRTVQRQADCAERVYRASVNCPTRNSGDQKRDAHGKHGAGWTGGIADRARSAGVGRRPGGLSPNDTTAKNQSTQIVKENNIIPSLKKAYAAELETVQNYLANSVWLDGLRAREVAGALATDVTEELGHAKKLAHRLKQLGACPPGSLDLVREQKALQPASDPTDLRHVIEGVIEAERLAIATYKEIIAACDGVDPVTEDLAVQLLADEEGHRTLFEGFLKSLKSERSGHGDVKGT
jgi:bacterioferritin